MLATSSSESDLSEPDHLIQEFEVDTTIGKRNQSINILFFSLTSKLLSVKHSNWKVYIATAMACHIVLSKIFRISNSVQQLWLSLR